MGYARAGTQCALGRALALAALDVVSKRSGPDWVAVRSGACSNELNVVVSARGFLPDLDLLAELRDWWSGVPASWFVEEQDEALTRVLVGSGWIPERNGRWCGRAVSSSSSMPHAGAQGGVTIEDVVDDEGLEHWLEIASGCGWFVDRDDLVVRRGLMLASTPDSRQSSWIARLEGRPVGMARGWCGGPNVEVVDVAVLASARRRGVGSALISEVLAWGTIHGAREAVAAPSPDGWRLFGALGFENVQVLRDVCFYWSG